MIIVELWKQQSAKFFCISTKSPAGKWKDHFFSPDEFGDIKAFLRDNHESDIYFCPHGFNRRSRSKTEAVIPNLLWADLYYANPRDKEAFRGLRPTIAIESSPGRFVGLWVLTEPMQEDINRRLTYHLDADHGGWDLSQALRFPGTHNYKYSTQPLVRVLWDDGPKYSLKRILKYLPPETEEVAGEFLNATEVFKEYQSKMPRWLRRELMADKMTGRADRSEMLWKMENACIECGMSLDESFAVIKRSAWNKFAGRRNEDGQLRRELEKIVDHHFKQKPKGEAKLHRKSDQEESDDERPGQEIFKFTPMDEIKEEKIDWLWYPYLAKKTLSILEGDPGLGKSYMAMIAAASIAEGSTLPCVKAKQPQVQGPVVYFDIENNAASVTKVRLKYNGFNKLGNYYAVEQAFSMEDQDAIAEIYEHLEKIQPILVVFDTLNTYIGKADTHKGSEATQAMNMFKRIADDFNCAVLLLRHLTKGTGSAIYRGQGSIAFAGSARVTMCVGVDPNDADTRIMTVVKGNLAPLPGGLSFRIEGRKNDRSEFIWDGFNNYTAQQVLDASQLAREGSTQGKGVQDAMEFLEATITGVAMDIQKLYRMAEKRSISKKMLDRAASKMSVEKGVRGKKPNRVETWELPESK